MKYFRSIWWPVTVGAVYVASTVWLGPTKLSASIYIIGLTLMWAMEKTVSKNWRNLAYEFGDK